MASKNKTSSLIIESHPEEYDGYPFITLIKYRQKVLLTVIDNISDDSIKAFIIDYCGSEDVNEEEFIEAVREWHETNKDVPVSINFSQRGIMYKFSKLYRTMNVEYVTRVIGPICKFNMNTTLSVRRKRRKQIQPSIQIIEH